MRFRSKVVKVLVWWLALGVVVIQPGLSGTLEGQEPTPLERLEESEAQLAQLRVRVAEHPESFRLWTALLWAEAAAVHARAWAEGVELSQEQQQALRKEAQQRVLRQWREARPQDAGPELVQLDGGADPAAREAALLDFIERYPADPLPVERAVVVRRNRGDEQGARQLLKDFLRRSPDDPAAYRLLVGHERSVGNTERAVEWVLRWADLAPEDPQLMASWLNLGLDDREPQRTVEMLDRRLATIKSDEVTLGLCSRLVRKRGGAFQAKGRDCLAQLAARTDQPDLAGRAAMALVDQTAAEGNWSRALETISELPEELRLTATLGIARRIPAPGGCDERVRLLRGLLEWKLALEQASSLAQPLLECARQPSASALFLQLLRVAPAKTLAGLVNAWSWQRNGFFEGELPGQSAEVVAGRLRQEAGVREVWLALERIYRVEGRHEERLALLQRWSRSLPDGFRNGEALQLAAELRQRERYDEAADLLRGRLSQGYDSRLFEPLWEILFVSGHENEARQVVQDLVNRGDEESLALAHFLSAQRALEQGDIQAAERAAWAQLNSSQPRREAALILLAVANQEQGEESLGRLAAKLCADYPRALASRDSGTCTVTLLEEIGSFSAAKRALAQGQRRLPETVQELRALAARARSLGDEPLAERAFERMVELNPKGEEGWIGLAQTKSDQGDLAALELLLSRARHELDPLPHGFLLVLGRGHLRLDSPRRAIDLLLEARDALPEGGEPAYVNADLRKAYEAFGKKEG